MVLMMQSQSSKETGIFWGAANNHKEPSAVQSVGPFQFGLTPIGVDVYVADNVLALILLEPV